MTHITCLPRTSSPVTVRPASRYRKGHLPIRLETVLVVEDDATMRLAMACMVADPRREVVLAHSADDALDRMPLINPDIILCDYMLEGTDGRRFCELMKLDSRWCQVPIIMVTRMDDPVVVREMLRSGAAGVLTKPVRGEELRTCLESLMRPRPSNPELDRSTATGILLT